ncbi:MAG: T9SS type A sorting domain-containing protein, partial [Bacteroidales bacterium]|nr:T9SS type A sorting domain-containing protein [Bacteroidales bacterium]
SGSTYDLVPDADWNGSTQITVTVTDHGTGELFDSEVYNFTVNPLNDAPAFISLSNNAVDEGVGVGTVVGLLISTDPDINDSHAYEFMFEGGDEEVDNMFFKIVGEELRVHSEMDYELKNTFSILVQTDDDNGGILVQNLPIIVNNIVETSIAEEHGNLSFKVYPVPVVDILTVELDNPENRELLLEIYSNAGKLVHSEQTINGNTISVTEFPNGMYILRISGENVYETRKIIVGDR